MISSLVFYLFSTILVLSALMVITARNPVHSVLFLILAFFNAAGLFVLLGAEFIAMILVIVYVGAVAVLFLFVVMMLDINFADLRKGAKQFVPVGLLIGGVLLAELCIMYSGWIFSPDTAIHVAISGVPVEGFQSTSGITNTEMLGSVLYTHYFFIFQVSGLILLVSMIGAIVLTLRVRPDVRKQKVTAQFDRTVEESMEIKKVVSGSGV
ncbi:MAG: NADH:ubiquinone oxidoreductase subunit J [Alphaproteobacteria bacterium CG_4_9_14_3_um_filter_47_13]|nr:MAG: NADH:ubiquinone oxidoreductase subunit J [Alphaproteobacteria bacterium CG_4_9_14_3_um_filter_47_13]